MRLKGLLGLQLAEQRAAVAAAAEDPSDSAPLGPVPPAHGCWGSEAADEVAEVQLLAALAAPNGWASGGAASGDGSVRKRQKLGSHNAPGRQAGSQLSGGAAAASMSLASSRASDGEEVATAGGLRLRCAGEGAHSSPQGSPNAAVQRPCPLPAPAQQRNAH